MRRFDITPRRAMPKGHKTFISYIALPQEALPTSQLLSAFVAHVHIQAGLQLIDLRTAAGLASIGADDELVNAADADYPKTRRWAHWLRANNAAAQGIIWHTRRNPGPGNEAVVLFGDRCPENLIKVDERIFLEEASGTAHLNTVLIAHRARIAAPRGSSKLPTTFDQPQLVPSHELVTLSEKSVTAPERAFPAAAEPTIDRLVKKNIRVSEPSSQEVHGVNSDKMRSGRGDEYDYEVCLSFAGEQRLFVDAVAEQLRQHGIRVFYDRYEQVNLWGKDLYSHLDWVYQQAARYCVLFVSADYANKLWTTHERKSAQVRALQEQDVDYILPARFDDTEIPGLRSTIGYVDLRQMTSEDLVRLIIEKVKA